MSVAANIHKMTRPLRPFVAKAFDLHLYDNTLALEMREKIVKDGKVTYDSGWWMPNALANEGQASMLNVYFLETTNVSKYLGLLNMTGGGVPTKTTTMSGITESTTPGTNGYSRQQITSGNWGSPALDSGDEMITAAQKTFGSFTGSVPVSHVYLTTTSTGTGGLFLLYVSTAYYVANAVARTFVSGESYLVTLRSKQV